MPSLASLLQSNPEAEADILGGSNLAAFADVFFQGILIAQFARYTNINTRDSRLMKFYVAGLALLTTAKTTQYIAVVWLLNVKHIGIALWYSSWASHASLITEAAIAIYVQIFLCHRLWILSHNRYVVVLTMALLLVAAAAACVATALFQTTFSTIWTAIHLGFAMSGDFFLAGNTVFYLLRHSRTVLPRGPTAGILNSLVRVTLQSAIPASLCALTDFVFTMLLFKGIGMPGSLIMSSIVNTILPKLWAWSAMWTLNSREDIYQDAQNAPYTLDLGVRSVVSDPETAESARIDRICTDEPRGHEPGPRAEAEKV
ncbi:hypothetical protein C8R47DRAFT_1330049 [Mycena vitilis]|nr:hypothetical protein C8R47DRAFT_1330049 [Mycena vitilis]